MISYARLTPGRGWRPLRAMLYYAQRVGVATPLGRFLADMIAAALRAKHPISGDLKGDPLLVEHLRREGYAVLPPLLSDEQIEEMLAFLAERSPVGNAALADYKLTDVVNCPQVMELANHPYLLALAGSYLGCAPTISTIGIRWSRTSRQTANVQSFHRDPDDWKMVKFFTYLTDVAEGTGPHVFIAGSQRETPPLFARRYSDGDIANKYGEKAFITIEGRRGTMFLADTSGVHKGEAARKGPRLMLEVGYTLLPVYAFNYHPVRLARQLFNLDPYINRLIVRPCADPQ
jgi:Phytanoyl-CoA dioxygenase (PhyH)